MHRPTAALILLLLTACGPTAQAPPWEPVSLLPPVAPLVEAEATGVQRLLASLPEAALEGEAARHVEAPPDVRRTVLIATDFVADLAPFTPFFGLDGEPEGGRVELDDGAVRLRGRAPHGISARSGQVPVVPGRIYLLRYRVRADELPDKRRGVVAAASLVGHGQGRRMGAIPGLRLPHARVGDWIDVEARFRVPDWADAVELSLDLARPLSDTGEYPASGDVRFDDVELVEEQGPVFAFFAGDAGRAEHPLAGRVALKGPSGSHSEEQRSVAWAPAPSALAFEVALPERAVLRLGSGLLPDIGGGFGSVRFTVDLESDDEVASLGSWSVPARSRHWVDREFDLARWGGQTVRIRLSTTARGREPGSPGDVSARGGVWSDPEIVDVSDAGRRIVLVGVDTLSAIRTSPWGHPVATTPNLERIAAAGTRYEQAWSPSPWTLPAFGSLLTGLGVGQHGGGGPLPGSRAGRAPLPSSVLTLAERLAAAGWSTRAWINNPFLTRAFGTDQGFDRHDDYGTRSAPGASQGAVAAATAWLAAPGADDRFAFVHIMEPHGPYLPTEASRDRFAPTPERGPFADGMSHAELVRLASGRLELDGEQRDQVARLHDAVVADADVAIGRLFDVARHAAPADRLLFAVVGDHGEELWDHGAFEHGHSAWDELVRVPLLLVDGGEPGRVVDAPVSTAAVAPTVLAFAGLGPQDAALPASPPVVGGNSLYGADRWYAWADGHKLIVEVDDGRPGKRSRRLPGGAALFDLEADPGELDDLLEGELDASRAAALRAAWADLLPELVASMGDHFVVAMAPGAALRGRIELDGPLPPRRRAFAWPDPDGRIGPIQLRPARDDRSLRFELPGPAAVLAIPARDGAADQLRLRLDDPPDGVPAEQRLTRQDVVDLAAFLAAPADGPRLLVGYLPGTLSAAGLDPAVLDQLRALGYVE